MTPELLKEARAWLSELNFSDIDGEDILNPSVVSDRQVERAIERLFDGGKDEFLRYYGA